MKIVITVKPLGLKEKLASLKGKSPIQVRFEKKAETPRLYDQDQELGSSFIE